jgi:hypothetical protein
MFDNEYSDLRNQEGRKSEALAASFDAFYAQQDRLRNAPVPPFYPSGPYDPRHRGQGDAP